MPDKRLPKYELTFWGGSDGVKYRRYHDTLEAAKDEAFRVACEMSNARAHQAIVYDRKTEDQVWVSP